MKKQLMTIGALCAATVAIYAASDRLDIFDKAGNFVSVMVNDIKSITLGEGNDADGFTQSMSRQPTATRTAKSRRSTKSPILPSTNRFPTK